MIKLDYESLAFNIWKLEQLKNGTGYKLHSTSELSNHCVGKMTEQTNLLYRKLIEIEDVLIDIVNDTIKALQNAGVAFENAESEIVKVMYANISSVIETLYE